MYVTTPTGHTSPTRRLPCFALLSFLLLLLTLGLAPHAARAATLTVTNINDSGSGSLRDAIATANTDGGDDTINFSIPASIYPEIILSSTLTITAPMTISGPSYQNIVIDGGNSVQIFRISGGTTVEPVALIRLTIADGNAAQGGVEQTQGGGGGGIYSVYGDVLTVTDCRVLRNTVYPAGFGGGLYNGGTVTLTGCTFAKNSASGGEGGGLYNGSGGTATLTGCTFAKNSVNGGGEGGGLYNDSGGTATLTGCLFTGNSAQYDGPENLFYGSGGGLCAYEADVTLTDCTFDSNSAANGGGIDHIGGGASDTVKLTNCILTRNSATYGGAIVTGSSTPMGATPDPGKSDTLTNCTLTANSATTSGGGVFSNSSYGTCVLDNDILYGDTAPRNNEADFTYHGTIFLNYCDIDQSDVPIGSGGDIDADPHFANLPYDWTLSAGSPCIGAGDPAQAGTRDINGVIRFNPPTIGANEGYSLVVTNADAYGGGSLSGVLLAAQSAPDAVITFDPYFFQDFRPITPAATLELSQSVEIIAPAAGVAVSGGNSHGVFQVDSGVQAILTGLTITDGNAGGGDGGGLDNAGGTATLTGCTLSGNSAYFGGGLSNDAGGTATLTGCTLTRNTAAADGGGLSNGGNANSTLRLTDCALSGNTAAIQGGGVISSAGTVTVTDCTLTGNSANGLSGGGILLFGGALTVTDCSFTGNSASTLGGAVSNQGGTARLDNDILYGDTASSGNEISGSVSATYCDINQSGYTGTGDISFTPLFVAPPGNLQLQPNSPCIGKGDPAQAGTYDILGTLRPNPPSIGAYEGLPAATRTRLRSSSDSSPYGQSVTFTATVDNTTPGSHTFPAGSVVFYVNGIPTAAVSLTNVNGVPTAVFTTSSLPAGTDFVTASLTGNSQFDSSSSDPLRHVVQAASTSTALTTYYNPSTVGEGCYFTATVANTTPGSGALPTGSVAFYLNGSTTPFDTEPVDQYGSSDPGTASTLYTFTQPGIYTVTAKYFGNSDFTGSSGSLSPSEQVNLNTPTVLVSANPSPSVYGQSVTFSVTVFGSLGSDSGVPNPTGTVTLQGLPGSPVVTLTDGAYPNTSVGSYVTSALPVGPNNYAAAYSGDSAYSNATVTGLGQTVNTAGTTTGITSSQNPSAAGKSVTFTATIANTSGTSAVPTGSVVFTIDSVAQPPVAVTTVNSKQVATLSTSSLSVGGSPHSVSAVFTPATGNFTGSNGSLSGGQQVNALTPLVAVTPNPPTSVFGQSVTLTVSVAGSGPTPTGTVTLSGLPGSPVVTLTNGTGTYTTSGLPVGANNYTAVYQSADANYNGATESGLSLPVSQAGTTTAVTSSQNPSSAGQSVTFTATVTNTSGTSAAPTGMVTFTIDSVAQPPVAVTTVNSKQVATLSTSSLSVSGSPHTVSAAYNGGTGFMGSSGSLSGGQTVVAGAAAKLSVTTVTTTTAAGTAFNVTVTAQDSGGSAATGYTGTVHFTSTDGQAALPANYVFTGIDKGTHTFGVTLKTAGPRTVTATDTVTGALTGTTGTIMVSAAAPVQLIVAAPATATAGHAFGATVTAKDAFGNPASSTATVSFTSTDPRAALPATVPLSNGTATVNLTYYTAAAQTLTASATSLTSGTAQTTVSSDPAGAPSVAVSNVVLTRGTGASSNIVTVAFSLVNTGVGQAGGVHITVAKLGTVNASSLGSTYTLGAGQSQDVSLAFTGVAAGANTLTLNGAYSNAAATTSYAFSGGKKVTVP